MPDYLVQYGTAAFVGRFTADNDLSRGLSVVVRSPRGLEIGSHLGFQRRAAFAASFEAAFRDVARA